jgi:hypothetical protein
MAHEVGVPSNPYRDPTGSLEGSRDTQEGIVVSTEPDICLTPSGASMVPVGYNLWAKQSDDALTTPTVKLTSLRSHNMGSLITTCHGDEAGTGGGVKSGTHNGICEPKGHSENVYSEGKQMIRHTDEWWMNNRNTVGKLIYVKDAGDYERWAGAVVAQADTGTKSDAPPPALGFVAPAGAAAARQAAQEAIAAANRAIAAAEAEVAAGETVEVVDTIDDWNPSGWIIAGVAGVGIAIAAYKLHQARKAKAEAEEKLKQIEQQQQTQSIVRVTGSPKTPKDEICDAACQCKKDRGGARTLTDCVAKKLRDKYYDKNGPKNPDGSPRYPASPTADGPRPEVSYDPSNNFQAAPSTNAPGMPSSQVPISGMPRPDISWWSGGKLSKIYELKFGDDKDTLMQRQGLYQDIARANGLDPIKDLIRINVDEDCVCGPDGGAAK